MRSTLRFPAVATTIAALVGPGLSLAETHTPQVYGIINKELRNVSQDEQVPNSAKLLVSDVDGFESRIGAKGTLGQESSPQVSYVLEIGVNSNLDTGSTENRVRPRIVKGTFTGGWGSVTIGQDWLPSALHAIQYDPLSGTTAQNFNLDDAFVRGGLSYGQLYGLGYLFRAFKDQVRYSTPRWDGLTYQVAYDTGDSTYDNTVPTDSWFVEHLLSYELNPSPTQKLNLTAVYGEQAAEENSFTTEFYQGGLQYTLNRLTVSLLLGRQNVAPNIWYQRTFMGLSYDKDDWTLALTYGDADLGNTHSIDGLAVNGSESQFAGGAFYKLNDHTVLRMILSQALVQRESGALLDLDNDPATTGSRENSATMVSLGFRINY